MSLCAAFLAAGVSDAVATSEASLAAPAMLEFDIGTQFRAEQFLAHVLHQSAGLRCFEDVRTGAEYEGRADLGNERPGDGMRYKGRGPIRLTGRANYRWAGARLAVDLEAHPELAAAHALGWRIAALHWSDHGLNAHADRSDFVGITRAITGGLDGLESRRRYLGVLERVDCRPGNRPFAHNQPGGGRLAVSPAGVTLITAFECCPNSGRPYRDTVGVWTIGYGHTDGVGPSSPPLTLLRASELLARDLDDRYSPILNGLHLPLTQHQFDALVSFVYSCGPGAISADTPIGRALRAHDWSGAADGLLAWDRAGGSAVAGLTRRRRAERAMFLAVDDPLEGFTDVEQRWIREYDRLIRETRDPARRGVLRQAMTAQRKKIWRTAQSPPQGGDGFGWSANHRNARYAALLARTT